MDFSALIVKFVIFVVLMLIGYFYARRKLLSGSFAKDAGKLTLEVFMSAAILNSVIANPPDISGLQLLTMLGTVCAASAVGLIVAALLVRLLPGERKDAAVLELLIALSNNMFIALPVLQQLFGGTAVLYVAMSNIPFNLYLYIYGVWRLKGGGKKAGVRAKDILSVPLVCTLVSVLIFALRIQMPEVVKELCSAVSSATMPISMVVIGASLGSVKLTEAFKDGHAYLVSALRLVVIPLLTWLIMGLFINDQFVLTVVTVMAACPSAIIVSVISMQYGHNAVYPSKAILMSTALSMLTIPAWVWFLMR